MASTSKRDSFIKWKRREDEKRAIAKKEKNQSLREFNSYENQHSSYRTRRRQSSASWDDFEEKINGDQVSRHISTQETMLPTESDYYNSPLSSFVKHYHTAASRQVQNPSSFHTEEFNALNKRDRMHSDDSLASPEQRHSSLSPVGPFYNAINNSETHRGSKRRIRNRYQQETRYAKDQHEYNHRDNVIRNDDLHSNGKRLSDEHNENKSTESLLNSEYQQSDRSGSSRTTLRHHKEQEKIQENIDETIQASYDSDEERMHFDIFRQIQSFSLSTKIFLSLCVIIGVCAFFLEEWLELLALGIGVLPIAYSRYEKRELYRRLEQLEEELNGFRSVATEIESHSHQVFEQLQQHLDKMKRDRQTNQELLAIEMASLRKQVLTMTYEMVEKERGLLHKKLENSIGDSQSSKLLYGDLFWSWGSNDEGGNVAINSNSDVLDTLLDKQSSISTSNTWEISFLFAVLGVLGAFVGMQVRKANIRKAKREARQRKRLQQQLMEKQQEEQKQNDFDVSSSFYNPDEIETVSLVGSSEWGKTATDVGKQKSGTRYGMDDNTSENGNDTMEQDNGVNRDEIQWQTISDRYSMNSDENSPKTVSRGSVRMRNDQGHGTPQNIDFVSYGEHAETFEDSNAKIPNFGKFQAQHKENYNLEEKNKEANPLPNKPYKSPLKASTNKSQVSSISGREFYWDPVKKRYAFVSKDKTSSFHSQKLRTPPSRHS